MAAIVNQKQRVHNAPSDLEGPGLGGGNCLGPEHLAQNLRFRADGSYVYVNNAKAACSTVKWLLWKHAYEKGEIQEEPVGSRVHLRDLSIWGPMDQTVLETAFIFSFVRNPFARVLSSYLDKVVLRSDGTSRPPGVALRKKFGLSPGTELSFRDFLRLIVRSHPAEDDVHWRPQFDNIFFNNVRLDYIGKVENFDQDISTIFSRLFSESERLDGTWTPHATRAQEKLRKHYGDVEVELVLKKYANDFAAFGYSNDPFEEKSNPVRPSSHVNPLLSAIVAAESLRSRGQVKKAIDVLLPIMQDYPDDPDGAHLLGDLYRDAKHLNEAATWLDRAVDTAVGRPGVFSKAAVVHTQLGHHDDAAKIAAIGLKEFPFNGRLRQLAEQTGGNALLKPAYDEEKGLASGENERRLRDIRQRTKSTVKRAFRRLKKLS